MKVIDFERHNDVITLYFGEINDFSYTGKNWNLHPYERVAGRVNNYLTTLDIKFPPNIRAITPDTDPAYRKGSPYCKNDFKRELLPYLVVTKDPSTTFDDLIFDNDDGYYFNESYDSICKRTKELGGFIFKEEEDCCVGEEPHRVWI